MVDMSPVAWCLITSKGEIINGVHEEERLAAQYQHRKADDTLTALFTAEQLAEAVAADRERLADLIEKAKPYIIESPLKEVTEGDFARIEGLDMALRIIRGDAK